METKPFSNINLLEIFKKKSIENTNEFENVFRNFFLI